VTRRLALKSCGDCLSMRSTKQPPLARTARCAESPCFQAVSVTTTAAIAARLHDVSGVSLCVPRSPMMRTLLLHDGFTADRSTIESDWPVMWVRVIPATDARVMTVCRAPRRHPTVQPALFFGQPMCPTVCVSRWWAGWDSAGEQENARSQKNARKRAESHQSAARFVRRLLSVFFIYHIKDFSNWKTSQKIS
jgi:hypothetical protein